MSDVQFRPGGDPLGTHRVVSPRGHLPQAAEVLDNSLPPFAGEVLIDVETLNIDAASFVQLEASGRPVDQQILEIVRQRGKMQNPVTGSGGMLLGRIAALGPDYTGPLAGQPLGTPIATLVSLTLTPLRLDRIVEVRHHAHQVVAQGQAMLSSAAPAAVIPQDLPADLVLAILDVCGAPALVDRLVRRMPANGSLLCVGAGKAGVLALAAARKARPDLRLCAVDRFQGPLDQVTAVGLADEVRTVDASDALAMRDAAISFVGKGLFDAVVNMASLPGTEIGAILACKSRGTCLFFGMATSFTRVALGAEGVGADVDLIIGNGYAIDHANDALDLVRAMPRVRQLLAARLHK